MNEESHHEKNGLNQTIRFEFHSNLRVQNVADAGV